MERGSSGVDSEPLEGRTQYKTGHTQTQRTSFVRMGYLLVLLAVVLVSVVAHNQSYVPSSTSYCPAAVDKLSNRVDQLISGFLFVNKQVFQMRNHFIRFELNLLVLKARLNRSDCKGCDLTTCGDNVITSVDYPSCMSLEPAMVDNGDGSYQLALTPD